MIRLQQHHDSSTTTSHCKIKNRRGISEKFKQKKLAV